MSGSPRESGRSAAALIGMLIPLVLAGLPTLVLPPGRDQAIYGLVGNTLLHGGFPYKDAFDFKPPGIHVVYAGAALFADRAAWGPRLLDLASLLAAAAGLFILLAPIGRRAAALGAWILGLTYLTAFRYWDLAQPEGFILPALVWSLVLVQRAGGRALHWMAAGSCLGWASVLKYPALAFALLVPFVASRPPRPARTLLFFATGVAAPIVLVTALLASGGALAPYWEIQSRFVPGYTKLTLASGFGPAFRASSAITWQLFSSRPALLAGLGACIVLAVRRRRRSGITPLAGVLVAAAGVVAQGKFFPYHWIPMLPFLAWGSAAALEAALARTERRKFFEPAGFLAMILLLAISARPVLPERVAGVRRLVGATSRDELLASPVFGEYGRGDYCARASYEAAAELARASDPGERVFVWGSEPLLYLASHREPASRFIYISPLEAPWCPRAWVDEIVRELRAAPPAVFVVVAHDATPWVTGVPFDSREALRYYPDIAGLLREDYALAGEIEHFTFFQRRR